MQRLSKNKPPNLIQEVLKDVVGTFGKDFTLTMEQYFTHIEQLGNVFDDYRRTGRPPGNPYRKMRENLLQALAALLDESVGHIPSCDYHQQLVRTLNVKDTIVSFNYDWVIDHTLRTYGQRKWNPRIGYGVPVYQDTGTDFWATKRGNEPQYPEKTISLLKMHGSMIWFPVGIDMRTPRIRLRQRWWHQHGSLKFEIAAPEWTKPIRHGVYKKVWSRARQALRKSKVVVFIGYSLPETDLPARALFMVDAGRKRVDPFDWLVIVNPDSIARRRIRRTLAGRISETTRVLTFDYFEEFSGFLGQK